MSKGEKHYKTRQEREVYKAAYDQAYWGRRNMERFEAGQPELFTQMQKYMGAGMEADSKAAQAGFSEEHLDRIHARALFDALVRISREGGIRYTEYFVTVERVNPSQSGEYDIASFAGDAPKNLQEGKLFTPFQLTDHQALVNCYYKAPMDTQEAMLVTMGLIGQGQLGNFGTVVQRE